MELIRRIGGGKETYARYSLFLTALNGITVPLLLFPLYRRDWKARLITGTIRKDKPPLTPKQGLALLLCGVGLAQYGNVVIMALAPFLSYDSYAQEMGHLMNGKSFWFLILLLGVLAPVGEEISFRLLFYLRLRDYGSLLPSLLISSLVFGVYHGNPTQAIYAGLLGFFFALVLELSGSPLASILLHMGANIWSITLSCFSYQLLTPPMSQLFLALSVLMIVANIQVFRSLWRGYVENGKRRWA